MPGTDLSSATPRVAIVGGGLTGLTAAWRLQAAGIPFRIFEKSNVVGGRTLSIRKQGFIFDVGAITMLPTYVNACALIEELGVSAHLHRIAPVIGIPRQGRIHRIDVSHPLRSLLQTELISSRSKWRLLKLLGPMLRTWNRSNYQTLAPLADWDAETIADYVRRELGEEIHEYIVGPIIRGNTLNATECAPAGELLWMLRQYAAPYLYGFDQGINFLAETLGRRLPVEYGMDVTALQRQGGKVIVSGVGPSEDFSEAFDACILALPPDALARFPATLNAAQQRFLQAIKPLPSVNVHVGLRHRPSITETFILPPSAEQPNLTTIVMDHLKAPGRAPPGKGVISLFCRDSWCAEHFATADAEVLDRVLQMAAPFIGDLRSEVETFVVQRWPYAIIKSETGLYRRIRDYEATLDVHDRVQLAGDFLSMGMEAAISGGNAVAGRVQRLLGARSLPQYA